MKTPSPRFSTAGTQRTSSASAARFTPMASSPSMSLVAGSKRVKPTSETTSRRRWMRTIRSILFQIAPSGAPVSHSTALLVAAGEQEDFRPFFACQQPRGRSAASCGTAQSRLKPGRGFAPPGGRRGFCPLLWTREQSLARRTATAKIRPAEVSRAGPSAQTRQTTTGADPRT